MQMQQKPLRKKIEDGRIQKQQVVDMRTKDEGDTERIRARKDTGSPIKNQTKEFVAEDEWRLVIMGERFGNSALANEDLGRNIIWAH